MQLYYHLAAGWILHETLITEAPLASVLAFSIAPDLPMTINAGSQWLRKRGRAMSRDDLTSWKWTYPVALFTHSLGFYLMILSGISFTQAPPWLLSAAIWGYGSHLAMDYFTHARDPYPPLYPFSRWVICTKFSYYETEKHSKAVNWISATATLGAIFALVLSRT